MFTARKSMTMSPQCAVFWIVLLLCSIAMNTVYLITVGTLGDAIELRDERDKYRDTLRLMFEESDQSTETYNIEETA